MRVLLLNQTFHPDVAATALHLTDLAVGLAERGHAVTVVTGRRAYDNPELLFPRNETWRGIRIIRIGSTGFGKAAKWRRAADFASFLGLCACRLLSLGRFDAIVALTSPPLISWVGAWAARLGGARFFYWVMDLNPDEAIAAGWLRAGSLSARILEGFSRFSLRHATRIFALDHFMRDRIVAKGIAQNKIAVLRAWSQDGEVTFDPTGRDRFRAAHGLEGKFVVMYSGNHSPCHPLDTILQAAARLKDDTDLVFLFVGGGNEWRKIRETQNAQTRNVRCLPYQSLAEISGSLSAADLHLVVMGNPFVGLVHPCKIYNILAVAAPVLYIGPRPSHVSELLDSLAEIHASQCAPHGGVDQVVAAILEAKRAWNARGQETGGARISPLLPARAQFTKEAVLPRMIALLEES